MLRRDSLKEAVKDEHLYTAAPSYFSSIISLKLKKLTTLPGITKKNNSG